MVRKLEHKEGIISGVDVRDILKVFPQMEVNLTIIKQSFEWFLK